MIKETPEIVREWLLNDDMETLCYQISELLIKSEYEIIDSHSTIWGSHAAESWILDDGVAFLRSFEGNEKLFFEMSSFNHKKHLKFVIGLKSLILERSRNLLG